MNTILQSSLAIAAALLAAQASAQITFYEQERYGGRSFTAQSDVRNFQRQGFNDRASSAVVRNNRWEVCEDVRYGGRCVVLRPGQYPTLAAMGLNDRVSSVRVLQRAAQVDDGRYAPPPIAAYDGRRRPNERLFEAQVTSARAVLGTPAQRCWIEREQVSVEQRRSNVPAALAGAILGGIIGHQIGGGTGRDIATAGGVVAGAAIGSRSGGSDGTQIVERDVQRCSEAPANARPDYWDVTYSFRGRDHRVQMAVAPGDTITVNRQGEPRARQN
jgi:uncharacterized protein YcfJ